MSNRCQHLRGADIRSTPHSDLAVRIGQGCGPLNRIVAVIRFMFEGVPLAVGGVTATHILNDDDVSSGRRLEAKSHSSALVVRRALQQHGKLPCHDRPVNVGAKNDAIAHRDGHTAFRRDFVGFGGLQQRRREDQAESNAQSGFSPEHDASPHL